MHKSTAKEEEEEKEEAKEEKEKQDMLYTQKNGCAVLDWQVERCVLLQALASFCYRHVLCR